MEKDKLESLKMMLFSNNIPCIIFWKDRDLTYQGGNEHFLKAVGVNSIEEVRGKTDYDLPWAADAESYRNSDFPVLEGKSILNSKELRWHINGPRQVIVNKMPLRDEKGNITGILGIHQDVSGGPPLNEPEVNEFKSTNLPQESEMELLETLKNISNTLLTHREIECLSLWLSGYSIKESSYCLGISQKSIEAYRKHIKDKMGVHHKYQLIALMEGKGAFHLFLSLAKLIQQKSKVNVC